MVFKNVPKGVLKSAIENARQGDHKHRVGCVIFKGKRIISVGSNTCCRSVRKLHPKYQKWEGTVHAEVAAIICARRPLKRMSMLVVRINNDEDLMMALPCEHCMSYIVHVGIKNVYYTDEKGKIKKVKVNR